MGTAAHASPAVQAAAQSVSDTMQQLKAQGRWVGPAEGMSAWS